MAFSVNFVSRLARHLAPYLNAQDEVVNTVLNAFAQQWNQTQVTWNEALSVFSILGATGNTLTTIGHDVSVDRLPNESDDHLLSRIANVLLRRPTQTGFQTSLDELSLNGPVDVYTPTGGDLIQYDPSLSYRWNRQSITGTFTRSTTAWDPYTQGVAAVNVPAFTAVQGIPPDNLDTQTALNVWQSSTNYWPHSEWETAIALTPTFTPNTTSAEYWALQAGTSPAYASTTISSTTGTWITAGPNYPAPLTWTVTLTSTGECGALWAWTAAGGYFAGISGTTILLAKGTTNALTTLATGTLPTAGSATGTITWDAGGSISFAWQQGTTTGTLTATDTTYSAGAVGWGNITGSGTFSPQAVQTPFPTNLSLSLPAGNAAQLLSQSTVNLPAPGNAIQITCPVAAGISTIQGPVLQTTTNGTWSWWGESLLNTGTVSYQMQNEAVTYTAMAWQLMTTYLNYSPQSWSSYPWQEWTLSAGSGTYTPQWIASDTQGTFSIGMPQWEQLPFSTPYIPNPATSTARGEESTSVSELVLPQNQGTLAMGVYLTDAFTQQSGLLWSLGSGTTNTVSCTWSGTQWVTTWNQSGTIMTETWDLPLAPYQWHYGVWSWGPMGWTWTWDSEILAGDTSPPWEAGTYALTFGQNAQYTNVSVLDGVLPARETDQWGATTLTPIFSPTVWQGNFTNATFAGAQGQMGEFWANLIGIQFPYTVAPTSNSFILDASALNQSALGGTSTLQNATLISSVIQPALPAGIMPFGWQRGTLT